MFYQIYIYLIREGHDPNNPRVITDNFEQRLGVFILVELIVNDF